MACQVHGPRGSHRPCGHVSSVQEWQGCPFEGLWSEISASWAGETRPGDTSCVGSARKRRTCPCASVHNGDVTYCVTVRRCGASNRLVDVKFVTRINGNTQIRLRKIPIHAGAVDAFVANAKRGNRVSRSVILIDRADRACRKLIVKSGSNCSS